MIISPRGLDFITVHEGGCKLEMYDDGTGKPTIGVGHLCASWNEYPKGITYDKAMQLFHEDLRETEAAVQKGVTVEISQHRFDALADFVYNVGANAFLNSTLLKLVNAREFGQVPPEFLRWTKAGGLRLRGLYKRRAACGLLWWFAEYKPGY